MKRHSPTVKDLAKRLRKQGLSYAEIATHPSVSVSRGTVVSWCKSVPLSSVAQKRLDNHIARVLTRAREKSALFHRQHKQRRVESAQARNENLKVKLGDIRVQKLILGSLYLAEGSKGDRSGITFGNSDPEIVRLFLILFRTTFEIDEKKFRCTVQARASQDIEFLEKFWSHLTNIPQSQFYSARIDPRSIGKPTRKVEYKGVCRIDYLSTDSLYEMLGIGRMLVESL